MNDEKNVFLEESDGKYDSDFSEDEANTSFENEGENTNKEMIKWLITGAVAFITFLVVFLVTSKLVNSGNNKTEPNPNPEEPVINTYQTLNQGDQVTLSDESKWHVLYTSADDTEFVSLLSDDDVNVNQVLYGNLNSFLKGTYKTNLIGKLGLESGDISDVRLLAYIDLADISSYSSSEFLPEAEMSLFNMPSFITASNTVTDTVWETSVGSYPVMVCTADTTSAVVEDKTATKDDNKTNTDATTEAKKVDRFCLGDYTESLPVRPVVTISKKAIENTKLTNSNNNVENDNSNENVTK